MRIVHITPGSGDTFYCENCIRDDIDVHALRRAGHDAMMVPLYLPPLLEGGEQVPEGPIFFGGINVYLQQKFSLFRRTPRWLDRLFDAPALLRWVGRRARMTDARALGETTLSMLRGEHGRQAKELERLVAWLAGEGRVDVVVLSNALLIGLARRIKQALGPAVACLLQDEDTFLDELPEPLRGRAWETISRRAEDVDVFIAVSRYYGEAMRRRLELPADKLRVVYAGISPAGYAPAEAPSDPPAVGYLSRMCRTKGLDILAEAFIMLKADSRFAGLKLRVAGGKTADDDAFIGAVHSRLEEAGVLADTEFLGNLHLAARQQFLPALRVLSVPERRGEAFALYVLEALAAGVPVVLPARGAAAELVEATGGGLVCEPDDPASLAEALAKLLMDADHARRLGLAGRQVVLERFTAERTAAELAGIYQEAAPRAAGEHNPSPHAR